MDVITTSFSILALCAIVLIAFNIRSRRKNWGK